MKESNENILPPLTMDRLEQRNRYSRSLNLAAPNWNA